jgi:hypothetical protein
METEIKNSIHISADDLTRAIYCGTLTQADLIWLMIPFRLEQICFKKRKHKTIFVSSNIYRSCNQAFQGDQILIKIFQTVYHHSGFWRRKGEKFDERG